MAGLDRPTASHGLPRTLIRLLPVAIVVAILYLPASELYSFRRVDRTSALSHYTNHSGLNNDHCTVHYAANACEDVNIHFPSKTAFLACGDPEQRAHWYPPSCAHNADARSEESFREDLFKYNIRSRETTKLRIDGLDGDFINHGIDIYSLPDDPTKVLCPLLPLTLHHTARGILTRVQIHIFAVNHGRSGDSIVIFSHILGSDSVQVVREVRHKGVKTANGVAAYGPL
jgi:arylesterase/paraoxonase